MIKSPKTRIELVDALRGLAVMAIMLLHNIERFNYYTFPDKSTLPDWLITLDGTIWSSLFYIFAGKAYAIFAILFGFTFYLQQSSQRKQGFDFGYRYLWRLLLLVGFACFNAIFFPGDVLLLFATVGPFLFITRNWSNKAVLITAVILLLQPVEIFRYLQSCFDQDYMLPAKISKELHPIVRSYVDSDSFWVLMKNNITTGQHWSLMWAIDNGRFLQTAGLFMVGMLIGRENLFIESDRSYKFWKRAFFIAAFAFTPLYLYKIDFLNNNPEVISKGTLGVMFDMWSKFAFTIMLLSSFVLLYRSEKFKSLTNSLRPYGKMSLTNYITQSIIGSFLYFEYGLALSSKVSITGSFVIAIVLLIAQIKFSQWWMSKYSQGPLEKLWHKLTWIGRK